MVDKASFIGMTGAENSLRQLEILTNNLANANTTAFRGDYEVMHQKVINANDSKQSRVYSALDGSYTDFRPGPIIETGRDLDLAISGPGFIAVQSSSGEEAYTRAGNLQLNQNRMLVTKTGELVLGNNGVINIPPAEQLNISNDGTVSARLLGTNELVPIDRIKFTNPDVSHLSKGADGLFHMTEGETAPVDPNIKIIFGALEGSNVSPIETLTKLIELSRHFEVHTNLMKSMAENSGKANQLLELQH